MSNNQKESILVALRQYHLELFPNKLTINYPELQGEYASLEDEIIGVVLSVVNGKVEFSNQVELLDMFSAKLEDVIGTEPAGQAEKEFLVSKIKSLKAIVQQTASSGFKLRKQRPQRISLATKKVVEER